MLEPEEHCSFIAKWTVPHLWAKFTNDHSTGYAATMATKHHKQEVCACVCACVCVCVSASVFLNEFSVNACMLLRVCVLLCVYAWVFMHACVHVCVSKK